MVPNEGQILLTCVNKIRLNQNNHAVYNFRYEGSYLTYTYSIHINAPPSFDDKYLPIIKQWIKTVL